MKIADLMKRARISPGEIDYGWLADVRLLELMALIREETEQPIIYLSSGEFWTGKAHSKFSLHKVGIDHANSLRNTALVPKVGVTYKAFDVACPTLPLAEFYLIAEKFIQGGGLGIYPYWRRPGLHIDVREEGHPGYGARWWRDKGGEYLYDPTWTTLNTIMEGR